MGTLYTLSSDHVARYNPRTKFFDRIKVGNGNSYLYDFALDRSTGVLFISDCRNSAIYAYDTVQNTTDTIGSIRAPTRLEAGRDAPRLFAVSEISRLLAMVNYKSVFVIEPHGHKVAATLPSPKNPARLVASPDCRALYILDHEKGSAASTLYSVDVANKRISGSLALDGHAGGMCISPGGLTAYISMMGQGKILAISTNGLTITAEMPVRDSNGRRYEPGDIAISPDGIKLYAATGSRTIAVIDLETHTPLRFIGMSFDVRTMAVDATDNLLYAACALVDMPVIDMLTDRIVKRMTIEAGEIKKIIIGPS